MKKNARKIMGIILSAMLLIGTIPSTGLAIQQPELKYAPQKGMTDTINDVLKLENLGNVMLVGAHPDDENNGLLVYLNKGQHADTAYAVSNWGEGGDNWIGQELYGSLGVVRSQELKSARMFDGAAQMYFGAYDFGYSVSLEESLIDTTNGAKGIWDPDILAYNLARLMRIQRPDVVFSHHRFGYKDHGQHQANGYLIEKAIDLAANKNYKIMDYDNKTNLDPWSVKKFYTSWKEKNTSLGGQLPMDGPVANADLKIDLGQYNNLLGLSYSEAGVLGRNMHKTQNMVGTPAKGQQISYWKLQKSLPGYDKNKNIIFGDIDTSINSIGANLPKEYVNNIGSDVTRLSTTLNKVVSKFNVFSPLDIAVDLNNSMDIAQSIEKQVKAFPDSVENKSYTLSLLNRLENHINKVAIDIYGVAVDVATSDNDVHPGQTFDVTAKVWFRGGEVTPPNQLFGANGKPTAINVPSDWTVVAKNGVTTPVDAVDINNALKGKTYSYSVTIPETYKEYTGPFNAPYNEYYKNPNFPFGTSKDMNADNVIEGNEMSPGITTKGTDPYSAAPISSNVSFNIGSANFNVTGEPELRVVPRISALVSNESAMNKYTGSDITNSTINVIVKNNMKTAANNIVITAVPIDANSGIVSSTTTISIPSEGQEIAASLKLTIPGTFKASTKMLVKATYNGVDYSEGYQVIDYTHIEKKHFYRAAVQNLTVSEFALPNDNIRIGYYTTGKDDFVMDYIKLMYSDPSKANSNLKVLTDADLSKPGAELKNQFDTIIVGKMGMSVKETLRMNYQNLIDYANAGGNLVVHYQNWRSQAADDTKNKMTLAPVPFYLSGTNINKENSEVYVKDGNEANQIYSGTNAINLGVDATGKSIAPAIWDGWIQQRCEWTAGPTESNLDPIAYVKGLGYSVLFQGRDPGDNFDRPAILYKAMNNNGSYTYSAVVWERQLQGLVPGAYKLYANLISMGYKK